MASICGHQGSAEQKSYATVIPYKSIGCRRGGAGVVTGLAQELFMKFLMAFSTCGG